MNGENQTRRGLLEGAGRILTELLKTPKVRQTVRILLREFDPENAPQVVAALTRTDPELFLGALSRSADAANALVAGGRAFLDDLLRFPPATAAELASDLLHDFDAEHLGEACGLLAVLIARIAAQNPAELSLAFGDKLHGFAAGFGEAARREEPPLGDRLTALLAAWEEAAAQPDNPLHDRIRRLADGLGEGAARYPHLLDKVIAPLFAAGREAMHTAADRKGHKDD